MITTLRAELTASPELKRQLDDLVAQQRLAYNSTINACQAHGQVPALMKSPNHPGGLYGQLTQWRHTDKRFQAPLPIHRASVRMARDAWIKRQKACDQAAWRIAQTKHTRRDERPEPTPPFRRKKNDQGTLTLDVPPTRLDACQWKLPGGLVLKTRKPLPQDLDVRACQIIQRIDGQGHLRLYLHLQVQVADTPRRDPETAPIGIDVGITRSLTLSNGQVICRSPDPKLDDKAAGIQKDLARKRKNSRAFRTDKKRLKAVRHKAARQRENWQRQAAACMAKTYTLVSVENLNVTAMKRSARGSLEHPGQNVKAKTGQGRLHSP